MTALLEVDGLSATYGQAPVLHGLDFTVGESEIVVLLGANGAGKTTTLRALSQLESVTVGGKIRLRGRSLVGLSPQTVVRRGVSHVPQGRGTFGDLTVEENLLAGAYVRRDRQGVRSDIARWFDTFPRLAERREQRAGTLSGGEQQMLAIARASMSRPALLLLDEPSLGLAPLIIRGLFDLLGGLNRDHGTTMLIVEQNANLALSIANRGYVMEAGTIAVSGDADQLRTDDAVRRAYLGF
ncbi:ABC transporter ATP-binding protein [Pseudofrankia inefficax]|uniref:ABC transporter related protein n=1 Tax=Pseudofrankia inefficax (strain DSM 45817 / CECT 9037 / DDB 130130 / EuI1c) TaxID=298654 RepID=E3IV99_PSEI1|nr:ABC transporter ATP-binding protein [Pseudofrankia inefficax]ADP81263.1 ABC transporter related protein [Pseudofrankia inefficax]